MTKRLTFLVVLLIVSCLLLGLHRYGRSLWFPLAAEFRREQTITSVLKASRAKGLGFSEQESEWVRSLTTVALKEEQLLEVWGHGDSGTRQKIRTFPFTASSGELGPKLREGDGQIPEGVYQVEYLNPNSSYHLSIKIDYPNAFDREKGKADGRERLGFDIFIHGKSVTVGCIPIGDEAIEDLFTLVAEIGIAKVGVIIAPCDFRVRESQPEISGIEWEAELYEDIREALEPFATKSPD